MVERPVMVGTQTVKKEHNCGGLDDIYIYIYRKEVFSSTTLDLPNSEYSLPSILYKVWFTGSGLDSKMESKIGKL